MVVDKSEKSENQSENGLEPSRTPSKAAVSLVFILVLGELEVVVGREPLDLTEIFPVNFIPIPCICFFLIVYKLLILCIILLNELFQRLSQLYRLFKVLVHCRLGGMRDLLVEQYVGCVLLVQLQELFYALE